MADKTEKAVRKTPFEPQRQIFCAILEEIGYSLIDLADFMQRNCDYRDYPSALRSLERMAHGDSRVSAEMMVVAKMLLRQHRRLKIKYATLEWQRNEHGTYWMQVEEWYVYVTPQAGGRWILSCRNGRRPEAYSPWVRKLDSLEAAQNRALACVEEGMNDMAEFTFHR